MALQRIHRLSTSVDELASIYTKSIAEIESLKQSKRQTKNDLKTARGELETLKLQTPQHHHLKSSPERKLMRADKKTAILKLEHQLGLIERALLQLEKERDRVFAKREEIKSKMVKKMVEVCSKRKTLVVSCVEDAGAVAKVVERVRVEPTCRISSGLSAHELDDVKEEARKRNVIGILGFETGSEIVRN